MKRGSDPEAPQGPATPGWDSLDEAGWESFPASDPPAIDALFELEPPTGEDEDRRSPAVAEEAADDTDPGP